jgi:hypothetical protein
MNSENFKMLQSRLMRLQTKTQNTVGGTQQNPLFFSPRSDASGRSPGGGGGGGGLNTPVGGSGASAVVATPIRSAAPSMENNSDSTTSFELDDSNGQQGKRARAYSVSAKPKAKFFLAIWSAMKKIFQRPSYADFASSIFKRRILFHRAALSLYRRYELIVGSCVLHIIIALLFGWVNLNVTPASVIAYLGVGGLFLILANAQFIFYMFTMHHVRNLSFRSCV